MQILVLILGTVLLSKACALRCNECISDISGSCANTPTECLLGTQCGSFTLASFIGGSSSSIVKMKQCVMAALCINGSVNYKSDHIAITGSCCNFDLCNSQDAPVGSVPSPNGKKCFYCDGQVCNQTLNCNGNEDYCISVKVTAGVIYKDCASKEICSNTQILQIFKNTTGFFGGSFTCCQGNLCNSASSTTAGLLLLVAPLISLIWIS